MTVEQSTSEDIYLEHGLLSMRFLITSDGESVSPRRSSICVNDGRAKRVRDH